jgi:hypothetical protein
MRPAALVGGVVVALALTAWYVHPALAPLMAQREERAQTRRDERSRPRRNDARDDDNVRVRRDQRIDDKRDRSEERDDETHSRHDARKAADETRDKETHARRDERELDMRSRHGATQLRSTRHYYREPEPPPLSPPQPPPLLPPPPFSPPPWSPPPPAPPPSRHATPGAKSAHAAVNTLAKAPIFCSRNPPLIDNHTAFTCLEHRCWPGSPAQPRHLPCAESNGIKDTWGTGFFQCMCTCCATQCNKEGCNLAKNGTWPGTLPNYALGFPWHA